MMAMNLIEYTISFELAELDRLHTSIRLHIFDR